MITIIVGTNRNDSKSELVAEEYRRYLAKEGAESQVLKLSDLPGDIYKGDMYSNPSTEFTAICDKFIKPVSKFAFVIPEYNGSFPGVLKMFIDIVPPSLFYGSKASLVGISAGRAGNIVGNSHFTDVLNHIKVDVSYFKLLLSGIDGLMDESGIITDEFSKTQLTEHTKMFSEL